MKTNRRTFIQGLGTGVVGALSVVVAAKWIHSHRSKQEMKRELPP
jgi:hypothetical protein